MGPKKSGTVKKCDFVKVDMALLEELCHLGLEVSVTHSLFPVA